MSDLARLRIWDDQVIRGALWWYLDVAENRRQAKFRIAATVATQLDPGQAARTPSGSNSTAWRISSSSTSTTRPFCIRRRCSRAPSLLRGVSPGGRRATEQRSHDDWMRRSPFARGIAAGVALERRLMPRFSHGVPRRRRRVSSSSTDVRRVDTNASTSPANKKVHPFLNIGERMKKCN
jgi:hypothetical protein